MYSFKNDYSEIAHPRILQLIAENSQIQHNGYGEDSHCLKAAEFIKELLCYDSAEVHFICGGTQTNLLAISAALRPHQAVIAVESGHIHVHETGAIEATGHKILTASSPNGKLTPELIQEIVEFHCDEHMVLPAMVYLSNSTELGTIYTKAELTAIYHFCKKNHLLLFLDGARLGSALTAPGNDLCLSDISRLTDAFSIGGTKNGAMFGEALILCGDYPKKEFRFLMKQRGAMLAKGFLLGIQFEALFQDNLYFELATHANKMAERIKQAIAACGFSFLVDSPTNQLFPILPNKVIKELSESFDFSVQQTISPTCTAIRLVTSWATTEQAVQEIESFFQKQLSPPPSFTYGNRA